MTELPFNITTLDQMIGRLWRVGQLKAVMVWLLTVDFTYDQVIQSRITRKAISQFASQAAASAEPEGKGKGKAREDEVPADESDVANADGISEEMEERCIGYYMQLYGFRSPRHAWGNAVDLAAKDELPTEEGFCKKGKCP